MSFRFRAFALALILAALVLAGMEPGAGPAPTPLMATTTSSHIKTVFLIVMENHNWASIKGNIAAPYINTNLLPAGAHLEEYYNQRWVHPSLPNYLTLEAGQGFDIKNDEPPSVNFQSTTNHLVTRLQNAGFTWKAYMQGISGTDCPIADEGTYTVKHDPFVYFNDVTEGQNPLSASCIGHIRPLTELEGDLLSGAIGNYNFIAPDDCHDMHSSCSGLDPITEGDTWLSQVVPEILASPAFANGGALFITWDEGVQGDGPIGMIVLSPYARSGAAGWAYHQHDDTLRTLEEIFGLIPPLTHDIATDADLRGMFWQFP